MAHRESDKFMIVNQAVRNPKNGKTDQGNSSTRTIEPVENETALLKAKIFG